MEKTASNKKNQSTTTLLDTSPTHLNEEHAASRIIGPAGITTKGPRSNNNDHDLNNSALMENRPATMKDVSHTRKPSILPHVPQETPLFFTTENEINLR
jgi:hypothetical protein